MPVRIFFWSLPRLAVVLAAVACGSEQDPGSLDAGADASDASSPSLDASSDAAEACLPMGATCFSGSGGRQKCCSGSCLERVTGGASPPGPGASPDGGAVCVGPLP